MSEVPRSSPYLGLVPYDEQDAAYFFGREKETRLILANLFASPLTLLYGPSGVGKSSILGPEWPTAPDCGGTSSWSSAHNGKGIRSPFSKA